MSAERRDRAAEVRERVRKTMREAAEQQPNAVERLTMHGREEGGEQAALFRGE